jgi:hypothetical protein
MYFMGNIKKAGSYFYKVANILILAIIINTIFFIAIKPAYSPEAMLSEVTEVAVPTADSAPASASGPGEAPPPALSEAQIQQAIKDQQNLALAQQAQYEFQNQQRIAEKIKERSYAINVLICINLFLSILIIYNLYCAANCLIEYDQTGKVEEPNIQKE